MYSFRTLKVPFKRLGKVTFATVAKDAAFRIPVIDFAKYRASSSQKEKQETAHSIVNAFKTSGFIYVDKHGIPLDTIENTFRKSKEFFKLPHEVKEALAWEDARSNRGYVRVGREKPTQLTDADEIALLRQKVPDYKESMEIGRDWDSPWKNQWPQESDVPAFKSTMLDFFQTCHNLHVELMQSIALGLDLEENFFDSKIDQQCHNLRLLNYPPLLRKKAVLNRAGSHSDYGTLTLLFQDQVGGLEVQDPQTGLFIPATPIPGTIIINIGDLLSRWSNDVLRSTLHRVVAPPGVSVSSTDEMTPARQSIAFFCNPNFDAEIACLPNCGSEAKYPPVQTEQYIVERLAATYI